MRVSPRARFLAITSVVATTIALCFQISAPASAADPAPTISVRHVDVAVAPGQDTSSEDTQTAIYMTVPGVTVKHAAIAFDTSTLPTGATLSFPDGLGFEWTCTTAGAIVTCANSETLSSVPDVFNPEIDLDFIFFTITAAADAPFGTGSMLATASGDGLTSSSTSIGVSVAQPVSFTPGADGTFAGAPGSSYSVNPTVTNTGTTTIHGIDIAFDSDYGFNTVNAASNCSYATDGNGSGNGFCHFANDLAPGVTYDLVTPMTFQISADHESPFLGDTEVGWFTPVDRGIAPTGSFAVGAGAPLSLQVKSTSVPAPPVTDTATPQTFANGNAYQSLEITVNGKASSPTFVALGAVAGGMTLNTSTVVSIGVRDTGPAAGALNRSGNALVLIDITSPAGTSVTAVPFTCAPYVSGKVDWTKLGKPGFAKYRCSVHENLPVGGSYLIDFGLKVTAVETAYTGKVEVLDAGDEPENERKVLSTAKITLTSAVVGSPSPSQSAGQPSASPEPTGTGSASASPTTTATGSPAPGASAGGSGLPLTGTEAGVYGGIGLVLLGLGIALFLFARQRRRLV